MDYNRKTKEFRILDHFLPQVIQSFLKHTDQHSLLISCVQESFDRTTATRVAKGKVKKRSDSAIPTGTGAWPREVGVHRVVWNNGNGLASSAWAAAGTASGLCRVEMLPGRWLKDKIPYGGISGIRMEDVDGMEVDSDLSDEGSES
jgi:transcription factor C subunit 6